MQDSNEHNEQQTNLVLDPENGNFRAPIESDGPEIAVEISPLSDQGDEGGRKRKDRKNLKRPRSSTRKRSSIWMHFISDAAQGKAKCNICLKNISYIGGSTNNLHRHLKSLHPTVIVSEPVMATGDVSHTVPPHALKRLAQAWLEEDTPNFDLAGVCVGTRNVEARLWCKTPGTLLAGCPFFDAVFKELGCTVEWSHPEGYTFGPDPKTLAAVVTGPARCVLLGERPALNCLARASGIATRSAQLSEVARIADWQGQVAGTRKTTPGFRLVEKYAMLVGGVATHRYDLSGMVMLKDNHLWAVGSITQAINDTRRVCGFSTKIEVECNSVGEGREAAQAGADIVMLDNFEPLELGRAALALKKDFPNLIIEASGGVTPETLPLFFSPYVDVISLGCLTQGCPVPDFSLKVQQPKT